MRYELRRRHYDTGGGITKNTNFVEMIEWYLSDGVQPKKTIQLYIDGYIPKLKRQKISESLKTKK